MRVEVIHPHGFCAGVERALRMARAALAERNVYAAAEIYCLHEIVHNETVVQGLAEQGMHFVESVEEVPEGAVMLISAHGVSPVVRVAADSRHIRVVDATCPFVAAAHAKIRENFSKGLRTVVVGAPDHAEVRGYLGEPGACLPEDVAPGEPTGKVVQTTLEASAYEGVCTATRDRQQAVLSFVEKQRRASGCLAAIGVLVVGSMKSANTGRLAEIAKQAGALSWRIGSPDEVNAIDFSGIDVLGVTSGASTPEETLHAVLSALKE